MEHHESRLKTMCEPAAPIWQAVPAPLVAPVVLRCTSVYAFTRELNQKDPIHFLSEVPSMHSYHTKTTHRLIVHVQMSSYHIEAVLLFNSFNLPCTCTNTIYIYHIEALLYNSIR
jgi:hypothetical protein